MKHFLLESPFISCSGFTEGINKEDQEHREKRETEGEKGSGFFVYSSIWLLRFRLIKKSEITGK